VEKGDQVTNFAVGDHVVVPFYTACQECYYCVRGQASRCSKGELFGNSVPANAIDGGQAEYVRVPLANSTLFKTPKGMFLSLSFFLPCFIDKRTMTTANITHICHKAGLMGHDRTVIIKRLAFVIFTYTNHAQGSPRKCSC
jgi:threonine dehydrogenase-like Zn-dependent dehydrogenase